jgi:hypothetical protein
MNVAGYRKWEDLIQTKEELHPDLQDYLCETEGVLGWPCLKHPLVFAVPYTEAMNAYYNEQLKFKRDRLDEAEREGRWNSYIFLHERPYRMNAFWSIRSKIKDDKEYWRLLGNIWTDTENQWQIIGMLDLCVSSKRPGRDEMMDDDERKMLAAMPDEFVIYRGHQKKNQKGFSWTLSYWRARWFARRFATEGGDGKVSMGTVRKEDVWAVLLGRNELEVAVHHKKIQNIQTVKKLIRPALVQVMLQNASEQFVLGPNSVHGPWHWDKVERNAIALCKVVPDADPLVCRLFAVLHDCKRENENDDPQHGHRAADYIHSLRKGLLLKDEQLHKLMDACKYHNDGQVSDDPTIGVCWDADRLDLSRVNITPDPKLLSTEQAKQLIWRV